MAYDKETGTGRAETFEELEHAHYELTQLHNKLVKDFIKLKEEVHWLRSINTGYGL